MHWSDHLETEVPLFSDSENLYGFSGLHDMALEIIEKGDYALDPKQLPRRVFECDQELLETDASWIALALFKSSSPVAIVEELLQGLRNMSMGGDCPTYCDLYGCREFEAELLRFTSRNYFLWLICGKFSMFDPAIHSIGLKDLRAATMTFSAENEDIGIWIPDCQRAIELDKEFWQVAIFPHVQSRSSHVNHFVL